MKSASFLSSVVLVCVSATGTHAQSRRMAPADFFRLERVGAIAWSADRQAAAIEISRPGSWLDASIPTHVIHVLDVAAGKLRVASPALPGVVGFFGPAWSPDGRRLAFLSVDRAARIRVWVWTAASGRAATMTDLEPHESVADPPVAMWRDATHVMFLARDTTEPRNGPLYSDILRGRNAADRWTQARAATSAVVMQLDSWPADAPAAQRESQRRIVSVNVETRAVTTVASGALHRPRLSADRRVLTYRRENPAIGRRPGPSFFKEGHGDAVYDAVNLGNETHHVDPVTGAAVDAPPRAAAPAPVSGLPTLQVASTPASGTTLTLSRPGREDVVVWRGNAWTRELTLGESESVSYTSTTGTALTGWLLYPPGYVAGTRIPIVTLVYPGTIFSARPPTSFNIFNPQFNHPQLFAALGYGVVLPSMPEAEKPMQVDGIRDLPNGVMPLLDLLVQRGIADPDRLVVAGQSAGGWATLGLIGQTSRFRSAIATAGYGNLQSLYGTFYGQARYGDSGDPARYQLLRMLQFERGYYAADAPPWERPERYRLNSPIEHVANVRTPLLLVQGDIDFIPAQQSEEFFTALYRQGRRAQFLRYAGEGHTIAARENVLDLWRRIEAWLRETVN